jgi:MFS family permease
MGAGQLLLGAGDPAGFELFSLGAVLFACSLVPIALTRLRTPEIGQPELLGLRYLFSIAPLGLLGAAASGAILGPVYGLAPVYVLGLPDRSVSVVAFMAAMVLGGAALQWPVGWLSDRFDRRTVLASALLCAGGASLLLGRAAALPPFGLLAAAALFGGVSFSIYPLAVAHANDSLRPTQLVAGSGLLLLGNSVGSLISPLCVAPLMDKRGTWVLFPALGAVALALAAYTVYRMLRVEGRPSAEQSAFVALPRTTPEAAELDPRNVDS